MLFPLLRVLLLSSPSLLSVSLDEAILLLFSTLRVRLQNDHDANTFTSKKLILDIA